MPKTPSTSGSAEISYARVGDCVLFVREGDPQVYVVTADKFYEHTHVRVPLPRRGKPRVS